MRAGLMEDLKSFEPDLVEIRRHPEIAFEKARVARLVADKLSAWVWKS